MPETVQSFQIDAAIAQQIIPCIHDGVVLVDEEQTVVYVNPAAERMFKIKNDGGQNSSLDVLIKRQVIEPHSGDIKDFLVSTETLRCLHNCRPLPARGSDGASFFYESTLAKLRFSEETYVAIILREVTEHLQTERARKREARGYMVLSECLEAVICVKDENSLLEEICRIAVDTGEYPFAWIGYAEEDENRTVRPLAQAGQENGYLDGNRISWADDEYGQGPTGRAIRTGTIQFSKNIPEDPYFAQWRSSALQRGFRASAAVPLRVRGQVIGAFNLYSSENVFDDDEGKLLTKLADNLSFGIDAIRTRKQREEDAARLEQSLSSLNERFKELNLFYVLSRLQANEGLSLEDTLGKILDAIPPAWQFPEQASARIQVEGFGDFQTPSYSPSQYNLREPIILHDREIGEVEVVYSQLPEGAEKEDVFIPEERELIRSLAVRIAEIVNYYSTRSERRKLSEALEQTADAVIITDREGIIEYVNPAFEAQSGYPKPEAVGQKPNIVKSGEHSPEFYSGMWETILAGDVFRDTVINRRRDGSIYYEDKTISPLYDDQGTLTHFLSTGKDITEQLQTESRLSYLASHDILTGLINQNEFVRQLDEDIASLSYRGSPIAVVVIGLDNFHSFNNNLGRTRGDQLLRSLAERLNGLAEESAARIGGDIFSIRMAEGGTVRITQSVESLLNELAKPLEIMNEEIALTATAGVSFYPDDGLDGQELIQKAETAMYLSKREGINRYRFYTADMQARSVEQLRMTQDMMGAMEREEFSVFYQPQIDLTTGKPIGAEALVRWLPQHRDPVSPEEFIPLLEEMGMIKGVGEFVLCSACAACLRLQEAGVALPRMAVNISAIQLKDPDFVNRVTDILRNAALDPQNLELEITESVLMNYYEETQNRLTELKALGVGVALDDFGTGYSSLQYLTRYPFSKLKIDKSFVWQMESSHGDWEVIKAIVSLGHSLGIQVNAEGVENDKHQRDLQSLGCDSVQGYYHSPPVAEDEFIEFLRSFR